MRSFLYDFRRTSAVIFCSSHLSPSLGLYSSLALYMHSQAGAEGMSKCLN